MALIAVDFDHTLVEGDKPRDGAKQAINILREKGHKILIYSCNETSWIKKVLDNADIRYDGVYEGKKKPLADLYIDDKGYHYKGDWLGEVDEILSRVGGMDNRKWETN